MHNSLTSQWYEVGERVSNTAIDKGLMHRTQPLPGEFLIIRFRARHVGVACCKNPNFLSVFRNRGDGVENFFRSSIYCVAIEIKQNHKGLCFSSFEGGRYTGVIKGIAFDDGFSLLKTCMKGRPCCLLG